MGDCRYFFVRCLRLLDLTYAFHPKASRYRKHVVVHVVIWDGVERDSLKTPLSGKEIVVFSMDVFRDLLCRG